jgi:uncharacterized protein (DUF983 family)
MSFEGIIKSKCPRCHEGDMFKNNNPYGKGGMEMYEFCEKCGQQFELETGFYWGAMYVSYALTAGWAISNFTLFYFLFHLSIWYFLPYLVITLILLYPLIFRISRSIYLGFFVYYDPNWKNNILEKVRKDYH